LFVSDDQQADDLTSAGMKKGVACSEVFILFLSEGVMSRPFVHLEVREALSMNQTLILVSRLEHLHSARIYNSISVCKIHEQDPRFHPCDFATERANAPSDLKPLFDNHESISWRRRAFERTSTLNECMRRAGPSYEAHFTRRAGEQDKKKAKRTEQRVSMISRDALWLDPWVWFRVVLAIRIINGCVHSAKYVACAAETGSTSMTLGGC
jgi:hypothetical protein